MIKNSYLHYHFVSISFLWHYTESDLWNASLKFEIENDSSSVGGVILLSEIVDDDIELTKDTFEHVLLILGFEIPQDISLTNFVNNDTLSLECIILPNPNIKINKIVVIDYFVISGFRFIISGDRARFVKYDVTKDVIEAEFPYGVIEIPCSHCHVEFEIENF